MVVNGTINDTTSGAHSLKVLDVTRDNQSSSIVISGAIGNVTPLADVTVTTGKQINTVAAVLGQVSPDSSQSSGSIVVAADVKTTGAQSYTANTVTLGDSTNPNQVQTLSGVSVTINSANISSLPTSALVSNGALNIVGGGNLSLATSVSGTGNLNYSGSGVLSLSGNNTYTGGTSILSGSQLNLAGANALPGGNLTSSNGALSVAPGVTLASLLTVNGAVSLASSISTVGAQTYNGAVTIAPNVVNGVTNPVTSLTTNNANIVFNGTLQASANAFANQQSLTVNAGTGTVTFNEAVGTPYFSSVNGMLYSNFSFSQPNFFNLTVTGSAINANADVSTYGAQTFNGNLFVGDNGSNGTTRTFLSVDPSVTINGSVNDASASGEHSLKVLVVTLDNALPVITLNGSVGDINPLANLTLTTGRQVATPTALMGDISSDASNYFGRITIAADVKTLGNQTYTGNTIALGDASQTNQTQVFESKGGAVTFNVGVPTSSGVTGTQGGLVSSGGTGAQVNFKLHGGHLTGVDGVASGFTYKSISDYTYDPGQVLSAALSNGTRLVPHALAEDSEATVSLGIVTDLTTNTEVSVGAPSVGIGGKLPIPITVCTSDHSCD